MASDSYRIRKYKSQVEIYIGTQCENKFKDVRKNYVKVKDHNANSTGGERKTCKFYEEMEEILGDKPCIKPLTIASSHRKRPANDSLISTLASTSEEDEIQEKHDITVTMPTKKKSQTEKDL